jgi:hypothetical protein
MVRDRKRRRNSTDFDIDIDIDIEQILLSSSLAKHDSAVPCIFSFKLLYFYSSPLFIDLVFKSTYLHHKLLPPHPPSFPLILLPLSYP